MYVPAMKPDGGSGKGWDRCWSRPPRGLAGPQRLLRRVPQRRRRRVGAITRYRAVIEPNLRASTSGTHLVVVGLDGYRSIATIEDALANIREAIELYLETLSEDERDESLSREILTTTVEVHA